MGYIDTERREVEVITKRELPGRVAVIEEETPLSKKSDYPYGIGRGWVLSIYFTDILVYEASYFGDEGGRHRARNDADYFLRAEVPPSFYRDGSVTFEDIRFDRVRSDRRK